MSAGTVAAVPAARAASAAPAAPALAVPALAEGDAFAQVAYTDPLGAPLLADLEREYDARYGVEVFGETASQEINRYPAEAFAEPHGLFLLLLRDGEPISGGAYMRYDETTAEVKRVWTRPDLRGQGLAKAVLAELERRAASAGYRRIYLTTGPRQPEAVRLYRGFGYTPLFDPELPAHEIGLHPFEKQLAPAPGADPAKDHDHDTDH